MSAVLESSTAGVTLILPAEPLSGLQASQFKRWMEGVLPDVRHVLLDLSRVEFMDSAGCGVLISPSPWPSSGSSRLSGG